MFKSKRRNYLQKYSLMQNRNKIAKGKLSNSILKPKITLLPIPVICKHFGTLYGGLYVSDTGTKMKCTQYTESCFTIQSNMKFPSM